MIGTSISRYDIRRELGQGGMSVVYLADDAGLSRQVAIKVLHRHLAKSADNRKRFRREAQAIARLSHPNILDVYDVSDEADERSFIVMEYIPGMNLREFVDRHGPPPPEVAALMGVEIAHALSHAHRHGVIHRDLKPENIMISEDGDIKLMDFGIAHVIDAETMTKTGSLLGSPAHMAPELIDGKQIDERVDVFALGTVLYWMCTGQLPFRGDNAPQVLRNVMECRYDPPDMVAPKIGGDLSRIICTSLSKTSEERFKSVDTVKRELLAAVHALGFDDPGGLLADYFADPERFGDEFDRVIVARLIARGKQAVERNHVPSAIALFNRVLAYDPQNEEVRQCLAQINQSRRTWQVAAALAIVGVAGCAGWWIYGRVVGPTPSRRPTGTEATVSAPPDDVATPVSRAKSTVSRAERDALRRSSTDGAARQGDRLADYVRSRVVGRTGAYPRRDHPDNIQALNRLDAGGSTADGHSTSIPAEADAGSMNADGRAGGDVRSSATGKTYRIGFKVFPATAHLTVDGQRVLWHAGPMELAEGTHLLRADAPGCKSLRQTLVVNEPRTDKIPVVLEWKNAAINVQANKSVLVYVGQESNPRANARQTSISVGFQPRTIDPRRTVNLRIADASNLQRVKHREVVVQAGDQRTVKVNFP